MNTRFDVVRKGVRVVFCVLALSLMLAMHLGASVITLELTRSSGLAMPASVPPAVIRRILPDRSASRVRVP